MTSVEAVPGRGNNLDQFRTLVLNANAMPLSTTPLSTMNWREAVECVYRGHFQVVEEWDGPVIRSPSRTMAVPKVVMATKYIDNAKRKPALSRINLTMRDRFRCGYCGDKFRMKDLTFDHVTPRSMGGRSTWTNLLMACAPCNQMKSNEAANYNGVRGVVRKGNFVPLKNPSAPTYDELYKVGLQFIPEEVRATFAEWLPYAADPTAAGLKSDTNRWDDAGYWTVELEP